jgi:hypothetical protein
MAQNGRVKGHSKTTQARIERIRVRIMAACPKCGAEPGAFCVKVRGGRRFASHSARWDSYRVQK